MRSALLLLAVLLFPAALFSQNPVEVEEDAPAAAAKDASAGFQFKFKDHPSFRYGENFQLDVRSKWHFDFRQFYPPFANAPTTTDVFLLQRARFGLKGKATKWFDYEIEREMRATFGDDHERHPWKDVNVDFKPFSQLQLKVGKFKMPFGMEQNESPERLDFIYRSQVSNYLTPARERGAMLHGKLLKGKRLSYEVGVFRFDGENSDIKGIPTGNRTYAGRLSGEPLRYVKALPKTIRHTYLGFAMTKGGMVQGQNSIHGQNLANFTYFDHLYVNGDRTRTGVELAWSEGPFGIKSEYIHVSEERTGQSLRATDLPDKITRGWYVTGSWMPYGKMKSKGKEPKDPFLVGKGFGAVELSARLDVLAFYSGPGTGFASRSPRAAVILPNSDRTWTFGSTWYVNHYVKIQANAEREWLTDIEKSAVEGHHIFWTGIVRLQLAM
jgi:phosphate-selective porin OprO and OprP